MTDRAGSGRATASRAAPQGAVVLLSGGLDSSTMLAMARAAGHACTCLSFDYGQRHRIELEAAARVARALGAEEHRIVRLDPTAIGPSALTGGGIALGAGWSTAVPKARSLAAIGQGIPSTYVPARNTIFLAFALGLAEVLAARRIYIGVTAVDYSGYPDCRPEYIAAFQRLAALATKAGVEGSPVTIETPLIHLTKAEIIRAGHALGLAYALTHSCYDPTPGGDHCGACDACLLRRKGFAEANVADPTRYGA
ncbi:MAG: 7-cyano-7-deazaguanine synthase QueC [Candidatus Lambdaproteobacteria bacterium]|nr:7-cyano-7-deazaguanine synthase QueC [Candidatus Lambdaproteobacteria bacterium]